MPAQVLYGDGSLYGDLDFLYARISSELIAAQALKTRQTTLRVRIVDQQLNAWEHVAGTHAFPDEGLGSGLYAPVNGGAKIWQKEFWSYRGGVSMIKLDNGTIVRLRNGNPADSSDRQLWFQEITDPTIASQWTSWSVKYSGSHYGVPQPMPTSASTYSIHHAKSDGYYIDNVFNWRPSDDGWPGEVIGFVPVEGGAAGQGWVFTVHEFQNLRSGLLFYTEAPVQPKDFDLGNYSWYRGGVNGIMDPDGKIARFGFAPLHFSPKDGDHGVAMYHQQWDALDTLEISEPYIIRGVGGGAGKNYIGGAGISRLSDGYYYFSMLEVHQDESLEGSTSLGFGLPVVLRSKDLKHWTEPLVGPPVKNSWGATRMVEKDDWVYWCDTEVVYRRPLTPIEHDISNWVPKVEFDLPRDNQPGSGTATVANPDGVWDAIKELSDREIIIEPGIMTADGTYQVNQFDRFFLKQINREIEGKTNRLNLQFGNIWTRLDTDMRDVTNHIGMTVWDDWKVGGRNKAFNYFFSTGTLTSETGNALRASGIVLYTGWKGHNADISVHFSNMGGNPRIITRYQDARNFSYYEWNAGSGVLSLVWKIDNVNTTKTSWSTGITDTTPTIRIQERFCFVRVWVNNVEQTTPDGVSTGEFIDEDTYFPNPGYVGFASSAGKFTVTSFHLEDFESALTTEDLIRNVLAQADFHDVLVGGADSKIFAIVWGPQTDAQTQAEALLQTLEIDKLQLIFRNGMVEVGKFSDQTPVRTIENEVIQSDDIDEAARRINIAVIDGNDTHWIEVDTADAATRGRMVAAYFDLPELLDLDSVKTRAREEISKGTQGSSPGGTTPLFFDLWRMDAVTWIDNTGEEKVVRIEGFSVDIDQGKTPHQRQTFDTSLFSDGSDDGFIGRPPPVVIGIVNEED